MSDVELEAFDTSDLPEDPEQRRNLLVVRSLLNQTSDGTLSWQYLGSSIPELRGEDNILAAHIETKAVGDMAIFLRESEADRTPELHFLAGGQRETIINGGVDNETITDAIAQLRDAATEQIEARNIATQNAYLQMQRQREEAIEHGLDEIANDDAGGFEL